MKSLQKQVGFGQKKAMNNVEYTRVGVKSLFKLNQSPWNNLKVGY